MQRIRINYKSGHSEEIKLRPEEKMEVTWNTETGELTKVKWFSDDPACKWTPLYIGALDSIESIWQTKP